MATALRVLIVEDCSDDALLLVRELRRGGYSPDFEIVDTPAAMSAALDRQEWEVVLSDHSMPRFSAPAALALLKARNLDLPFLIVSGAIGEDSAVAAMKAGAHDYIVKDNLCRLLPAVERELREARVRSDQRRAEEMLRQSEDRYRTLVELSPDAVAVYRDGKLAFLNSAGARLLCAPGPEELIGRPILDFVHPECRGLAREHLIKAEREGTSAPLIEEKLVRLDGAIVEVETVSQPCSFQGRPAVLAVIRDISVRRQLERERESRAREREEAHHRLEAQADALARLTGDLALARDEAVESGRVRSRFLANMSHEIRTPLNSILGMTALLLGGELTSEQRILAESVRFCGQRLLDSLTAILDYSALEAGRMDLEVRDFGLRQVLQEALGPFQDRAASKGLKLDWHIEDNVPCSLRGDALRISQILEHLAGNAIKFTRHGKIEACVSLTKEYDDAAVLRVEVRDTGIGVAADVRERLFQPFFQVDSPESGERGGSGLGLAISRKLLERMGGEIGVQSQLGRGSTFWFTLPLEKQETNGLSGPR